jgi:hypothetical protein
MARIRSIKPELRTSITVSSWPIEVRYLFVLLWGYLDDYGRGVDDTLLIASDCFPRDREITPDVVDTWLETMADAGPLCRYEVDGKPYLHCPSWSEHQKPQHPGKPRVPPCPDCEPDPFNRWRAHNPPRAIRRSRKSREDLMRVSPDRSSTPMRASGNTSDAPSEALGATIIQMPGQMSIEDEQGGNTAGQPTSEIAPESLTKTSGDPHENLTPEQGAGSREQGSREGERARGRELALRDQNAHTPIDDSGFRLTDELRRWAKRDGYTDLVDIDHATAQFISHYRSTGQNRRNWPEAWRKWIRDDHKRAAERSARRQTTSSRQQQETDDWFERSMTRAAAKDAAEQMRETS